jgi:hypothetical protein
MLGGNDIFGLHIYQIGYPVQRLLEGHFVSVYADNLEVGDGTGTTRRVLLVGDPIQISYNDLTDKPQIFQGEQGPPGPPGVSPEDPGYLPPTPLTSALERGYQYVANTAPDPGYDVFGLSGDGGALFPGALFPLMISLNVPKSVVSKYQIGAGLPSRAPENWSLTFYDEEDVEIGADVRTGESFSLAQIREFSVSPGASVSKAVLSISKIPLNVARNSTATRVNENGVIEVVPANTPRFNYDPVTLTSLGLLIEPEAEKLIAISNMTSWSRTRVNVTATNSSFADQI